VKLADNRNEAGEKSGKELGAVSVKSIGGRWVADDFAGRWDAAVAEHLRPRLDLVALRLSVAGMRGRR
jgi:hypothetical protein